MSDSVGSIRFFVPGNAVGKGRPKFARRGNFVHTYTPEKTASYESLIKLAGSKAMNDTPPTDKPVFLTMHIGVQVPASWSKKKRVAALGMGVYPAKKPDIDNIIKCVGDALNGVVWIDDSQIVGINATKRYSETPGINVGIELLKQGE